ncbi:hypothetical protein P7C70_g4368, partial [Phenoliferia sp. Uapishka_3]
MFASPRPATTAFDFTHPAGEAARGFTPNKNFAEYISQTPKVISKLVRHIHEQINASEETRASCNRRNHVLSLSEQKGRMDADHDFYEHLRLALHKTSGTTVSYMNKTLSEFEVLLTEQEHILDVMLSGAVDTEDHPRAKHLEAMTLENLKYLLHAKSTITNRKLFDKLTREYTPDAESSSPLGGSSCDSYCEAHDVTPSSTSSFIDYGSSPPVTPTSRRSANWRTQPSSSTMSPHPNLMNKFTASGGAITFSSRRRLRPASPHPSKGLKRASMMLKRHSAKKIKTMWVSTLIW